MNEWDEAARTNAVKKMSFSCSSFVYHCVISARGNETIEVCLRIVCKNASLYHQIYPYQFQDFYIASQFSLKSLFHSIPFS